MKRAWQLWMALLPLAAAQVWGVQTPEERAFEEKLAAVVPPKAVIFGKGPDIRWAGNESGLARETEWSVVGPDKPEAEFQWPDMTGRILGDRATLAKAVALHWYPAEATTIGYKRIVPVPETSVTHLRIRFDSYRVAPTIAEVELFY